VVGKVGHRLWLTLVVGRCGACGHRKHREEPGIGEAGMGAGYALGAVSAMGGSQLERMARLDDLLSQGLVTEAEYRIARTAVLGGMTGDD
jgi:hypothetical protein